MTLENNNTNNIMAVILLTMNQIDKTLRCLASFQDVKNSTYKIILWDNGSKDGTAETVRKAFPKVLVHYHHENIGVASGRNAAAKIAIDKFNPRYLFFMDNDMTVTDGFLDALARPFSSDSSIAQTTGKIMDLDNPGRIYGAGGCRTKFWLGNTRHVGNGEIDHGQYDTQEKCLPSGGCMLVRTDIFQQFGGFDTTFDPYGPEDLDFGLRVAKAGYFALYVPEAVVFHETRPGRTFEGGHYSETFATHRAKHWLIFMRRHASPQQKAAFLLFGAPYLAMKVLLREGRRGNLRGFQGLLRGAFDFLKSSLIRTHKTKTFH
jgi:GT2 family glycosyltransferase